MVIPKREGTTYYTLEFTYNSKPRSVEFEIKHKFGDEVEYIVYSNNQPTMYFFRKIKDEPFYLAYGSMQQDLSKTIVTACEEDYMSRFLK
ncbi:hypothetical protein [Sphingobacterium psychroaquaticum]|uniref:Uncharacterized protein n=1 Tax=Sphingobacterium psychroaquaticum TaxID=561061 RepID=A0A1X7JWQ1_9SPHI|nr:hypothetical protein [Sphingobacterium psychroaquaticum]SMG32521.1 hypothetical protein SAMN05660862_2262 [Sphingobacterium psychroaquaticum]